MDSGTVADKVRALRTARGWSREELARRAGREAKHVANIEARRFDRSITVDEVAWLASALDVTVMTLLAEPGEDVPTVEVTVTVARHACDVCQGRWGDVEALVRTDLAALEGVMGLNRGLSAQALVLARAMDACPDPAKLTSLSRELRMVMDTISERVTPASPKGNGRSSDSGNSGNSGGGGGDLSDLAMPVLSS
jgi:transcriptional regulator with XRE-family HTH domain